MGKDCIVSNLQDPSCHLMNFSGKNIIWQYFKQRKRAILFWSALRHQIIARMRQTLLGHEGGIVIPQLVNAALIDALN